ncbi:MAG: ABC transporter ATP-binding protein, partial [Clostridia bacterium]
ADEGEILLDGNDINKMSLGEIGQKVNYLFQEPRKQLFTTNVFSEMTFVGELLDKNMEEVEKKANMLLEKFNLSHCKTRSVYRLSRGETQRLCIASLLMNDLDFLILDEPTTGLDKENREILFKTIDELKNNGIGIAIVTHDNELIDKFSENLIELNSGKVCRLKICQQEINQENLEENE